ncbi:otopetrin-1-like [Lingula anatina]|uniref:Otopetrin-1-like n=1 Tax=Lingula anatina TaxID=7574 RepID=A0A2R2MKC5_LINAN|nr:otopetrin-1-like [Lingula anatina]|eukprot:XP_023930679.1 otopetrin-1-like [Lingula anatina]
MPTKEEPTNGIFEQLAEQATPFLYPCAVEFNLIVAGFLYIIWRSVGKSHQHGTAQNEDHAHHTRAGVFERIDCSNSTIGFLLGIVILIYGVAAIVFFMAYDEDKTLDYKMRHFALLFYQTMHVVTSALMCVALGAMFLFLRRLDFDRQKDIALDRTLLIVSLTGLFALAIFNAISAVAFDTDASPSKKLFEDEDEGTDIAPFHLTFTIAVFQILEAMMQTACILDGLRRRPGPKRVSNTVKQGRQFITFLLVCNVSLWILSTFEVKCPQTSPVSLLLYHGLGWCIISHISMPMVIFFRFHSAACMFEIWKEAFTD